MNTNQVVLEGGVTRDPEIREAGKSQVANFGVAQSRSWKDKETGEWKQSEPNYVEVQAWGPLAEKVMQLTKGDKVILVGELKFDTWEKDGTKRSKLTVTAQGVGIQLGAVNGNKAKAATIDDEDIPF